MNIRAVGTTAALVSSLFVLQLTACWPRGPEQNNAEPQRVNGVLTIPADNSVWVGGFCGGTGTWSDLHVGTLVTVVDDSGRVVAQQPLAGVPTPTFSGPCKLTFDVTIGTKNKLKSKGYTVVIDNRPPRAFTVQQLQKDNWHIEEDLTGVQH